MAEANASGNTDKQGGKTGNTSKDTKNEASQGNTEKVGTKVIPGIFANYVAKNPPPQGGASVREVYDDTTGILLFRELSAKCCHGGENIPAGQFRGGGQDIPTGHQSGYGGNPSAQQPTPPAQPKTEEKRCEEFPKGSIHGADLIERGFRLGKECCGGHKTGNKTPWGLIALVIALMAIAAAIYIYKDSQALGNKAEEPQVETPTPQPSVDPYKQPTGPPVAESHIHPVTFIPPPAKPEVYGEEWKVANQNTVVTVYDCLTRDAVNFRKYVGGKLDGVDKFDFMSSILATYVANNKTVFYDKEGVPTLADVGAIADTCTFVRDLAYRAGNRSLYGTPREDKGSLDWWANSSFQRVPSSKATNMSNAVRVAIHNLNDGLENLGGENGLNGVVRVKYELPQIVASYNPNTAGTENANSTKNTTSTRSSATDYFANLDYISPIPFGYRITGEIGDQREGHVHAGQDLARPEGVTPEVFEGKVVVSCSPGIGRVISAKREGRFGNCVRVDAGDTEIIYAHLKFFGPNIRPGASVKQGDVIGNVGSTGKGSTGPHLHIEFIPKTENFVTPIFGQKPELAMSSGFLHLKGAFWIICFNLRTSCACQGSRIPSRVLFNFSSQGSKNNEKPFDP